jgi:hypothetical protein
MSSRPTRFSGRLFPEPANGDASGFSESAADCGTTRVLDEVTALRRNGVRSATEVRYSWSTRLCRPEHKCSVRVRTSLEEPEQKATKATKESTNRRVAGRSRLHRKSKAIGSLYEAAPSADPQSHIGDPRVWHRRIPSRQIGLTHEPRPTTTDSDRCEVPKSTRFPQPAAVPTADSATAGMDGGPYPPLLLRSDKLR